MWGAGGVGGFVGALTNAKRDTWLSDTGETDVARRPTHHAHTPSNTGT
jgi:hypothetical protein